MNASAAPAYADGAALLLDTPGFALDRRGRFLRARLKKPHLVLSTSHVNGGQAEHLGYLVNHQSCEAKGHMERHEALTAEGPVIAIRAPGAGEPRVTLTLQQLLGARALYLHIEGEEKVETLDRAEAEGPVEDMPVRAILRQTRTPLTIFWCP